MITCAAAVTAISCSKAPAAKAIKDFGVVELTENTPKRLSLAEGKEAFLTATTLPDGLVHLVFKSESKPLFGTSTRLQQETTIPPGEHIIMSVDGVVIGFKPTVKTQ